MRSTVIVVLVGSLFLAACAEPQIDGSSEAAFRESLEEIRATLSDEERAFFDRAVESLDLDETIAGLEMLRLPADSRKEYLAAMDGKTADEVIAARDESTSAFLAAVRGRNRRELEKLEAAEAKAGLARAELVKFEVLRSRFYVEETSWSKYPTVELTVRNGTDHPISRAYFIGTVATPGRAIPWIKEEFNHSIPGGVEPGEEVAWELTLREYGPWGRVEVPDDAVLTVEVVQLDGPDGEPLFSSRGFTEEDARRLEELRAVQQ